MNVDEVLETVEQTLLSRQLSNLERLILCQSWLRRGYSDMASNFTYSIAHIKDTGSQLWQALSKAIGERVTKKNLFLVLKQYLLFQTSETATNNELSVTLEPVEVTEPALTPSTNQLPVTTDFVEASSLEDSVQLPLVCDRLVFDDMPRKSRRSHRLSISYSNCIPITAFNNFRHGYTDLVSVICHRASWNQFLAVVGALIDQFRLLTKAINYVRCFTAI
ncbi:MAG: hypothetical protein RM347_031855 [Nostoc sp. ChiQUE02]|uniref:hypothetical protein n=1 Tax=Nostoc sp. ChiQUE02 TaxID=3075377 RepID=UPI002AD5A881|nr:hypothetical protein [Nostoc sp. ChiQUE02]MDZ8233767.1 hypothetical protein [Nostoc sp. ChiQUE02]